MKYIETESVELKGNVIDDLEKEVVAFLNDMWYSVLCLKIGAVRLLKIRIMGVI